MSEKNDNTPAKMSGQRRSIILAAVIAVVVTAWVASGMLGGGEPTAVDQNAEAEAEQKPIAVRVETLEATQRARRIALTGRTVAIDDITVVAETSGRVVERPLRKGATVEDGDLLLRLAFNDRQARLEEAQALVASAQISFDAAQNLQRKQFESQVRLAESRAELAAAKASLAAIELDISRTRIRAPISGYLEDVMPDPGDFVESGDVVAVVVQLDPMRVTVNVTETDIQDVAIDDLVTVRLPNGREVGGTIQFISRVANEATRTFPVDIWIDNPAADIPVGVTSEVTLNVGTRSAHKLATSALTLDDLGRLGVRAVDASNTVQFIPVRILEDTPTGVWVTGLPNRARVVVLGQEFIVEGQVVEPQEQAPPAAESDSGNSAS